MYIEPNTKIYIIKKTGLTSEYDHSIFFNSKTERDAFFLNKAIITLVEYSYQRERKSIRCGLTRKDIEGCDYIAFVNDGYGEKIKYAFIDKIDYINDSMTEIFFSIDDLQTYLLDCEIPSCFVERQHSETDEIGENIIPESVETGEYIYNNYGKLTTALDPMAIAIMIVDEEEDVDGTLYDGIYGGFNLYLYNATDTEGIKNKLNAYIKKPESIIGMYMLPVLASGSVIPSGGIKVTYSTSPTNLSLEGNAITGTEDLDGYIPKNKKLYTYPYNFFAVFTPEKNENYRYEFFEENKPKFKIEVPMLQPLQVRLYPSGYKGVGENTTDSLIISGYPQCGWSNDSFKTWLAQNTIPIVKSTIGAVGGVAMNLAGIPTVVGLDGVKNLISSGYQASQKADLIKGNVASGNIAVATKTQTFYGARMSVSKNYAVVIDNYFTRYGYAQNKIMKPKFNVRAHWTYIKTNGVVVKGGGPASSLRNIANILNNGITFWKNAEEIGNYELDNSI